MNDGAPLSDESEPTELPAEVELEAPPGFQAPVKGRYRPSEAWALRWLGNPGG